MAPDPELVRPRPRLSVPKPARTSIEEVVQRESVLPNQVNLACYQHCQHTEVFFFLEDWTSYSTEDSFRTGITQPHEGGLSRPNEMDLRNQFAAGNGGRGSFQDGFGSSHHQAGPGNLLNPQLEDDSFYTGCFANSGSFNQLGEGTNNLYNAFGGNNTPAGHSGGWGATGERSLMFNALLTFCLFSWRFL